MIYKSYSQNNNNNINDNKNNVNTNTNSNTNSSINSNTNMNKQLERQLREIVTSLESKELNNIFKCFQIQNNHKATVVFNKSNIKCIQCELRYNQQSQQFCAKGFGRDQASSLTNAMRNILQNFISKGFRVESILKALRSSKYKEPLIRVEKMQKINGDSDAIVNIGYVETASKYENGYKSYKKYQKQEAYTNQNQNRYRKQGELSQTSFKIQSHSKKRQTFLEWSKLNSNTNTNTKTNCAEIKKENYNNNDSHNDNYDKQNLDVNIKNFKKLTYEDIFCLQKQRKEEVNKNKNKNKGKSGKGNGNGNKENQQSLYRSSMDINPDVDIDDNTTLILDDLDQNFESVENIENQNGFVNEIDCEFSVDVDANLDLEGNKTFSQCQYNNMSNQKRSQITSPTLNQYKNKSQNNKLFQHEPKQSQTQTKKQNQKRFAQCDDDCLLLNKGTKSCIYQQINSQNKKQIKSLSARIKLLEEENGILKELLLKQQRYFHKANK